MTKFNLHKLRLSISQISKISDRNYEKRMIWNFTRREKLLGAYEARSYLIVPYTRLYLMRIENYTLP